MFFGLSKLFWIVCAPSHIAAWLVLAAVVLLYRRRQRAAHICAAISAAILIVFGFTPVSVWLMRPIENQYPRPTLPQHIDGILILGGGLNADIYLTRGTPNSSYGLSRLVAGYELARRHPEARVVYSSGLLPVTNPHSEAAAARAILTDLGLPPERLVIESKSRNTSENFVYSKAIVKPKPGETWVVVTSALHMPRTMAIAAKVGWPMLPWPADYTTNTISKFGYTEFTDNLDRADLAIHEDIGLIVYRLTGKAY